MPTDILEQCIVQGCLLVLKDYRVSDNRMGTGQGAWRYIVHGGPKGLCLGIFQAREQAQGFMQAYRPSADMIRDMARMKPKVRKRTPRIKRELLVLE